MKRSLLLTILLQITWALAASKPFAADTHSVSEIDKNLRAAEALILQESYLEARRLLDLAMIENPGNPDLLNLRGFAARKAGNLGDAAIYYASALEVSPDHIGALEYQGELYLLLDRPHKAKANLNRLRRICGESCEEYRDLANEIAAFKHTN